MTRALLLLRPRSGLRGSRRVGGTVAALLLGATIASGQSSPNFQLSDSSFNNGGDPQSTTIPVSAGFRIGFDTIGGFGTLGTSSSPLFSLESGFSVAWRAPAEVLDLRFAGKTSLAWQPEGSIGSYNLYRGNAADLATGYGTCRQPGLSGESATEGEVPPPGGAWFYLITAENRLGEEGTFGRDSFGNERPNGSPCP